MKAYLYRLLKKSSFLGPIIENQKVQRLKKRLRLNPAILNTVLGRFNIYHPCTQDHLSVIKSTILMKSYDIRFCIQGKVLLNRMKSKEFEKG
jgi:hypothetical protein